MSPKKTQHLASLPDNYVFLNLQIPVMILYGKNDSVIPVADVEAFATGFSKSILAPYTATGHAIHWEFPKEFVYDIAFFRKEIEQERFLR